MFSASIVEKVREIAKEAALANGAEFVHLELSGSKRNPIVRVFADKEGGIGIEDCANISRTLEDSGELDEAIPGTYILEVSSPGLDRELYSIADFAKFVGKLAKIKLSSGEQKSLNGRIVDVEENEIVFDDRTSGEVRFSYDLVAKANLKIDLSEELARK
jgi:ribosome maturation factor RimP